MASKVSFNLFTVAAIAPESRRTPARSLALVKLVPWLVRNRLSVGPGAGLTTIGGLNLVLRAQRSALPLAFAGGTPLHGLNKIELDRRANELGFDYIRR